MTKQLGPGRHKLTPKQPGMIARRHKRSRTGCVGVSFYQTKRVTSCGATAVRHYYCALLAGKKHRVFCVESLGRQEAWRRAVRARAEYEREVQEGKAFSTINTRN